LAQKLRNLRASPFRDDSGKEPGTDKWIKMEDYIRDKGEVIVASTYCPECGKKAMEEIEEELPESTTVARGGGLTIGTWKVRS
jgi:hypothetical protein